MREGDASRADVGRSPFDPSSEVGRALAEVDWAATELGPWQEWPVSLSTAVRAMLGSRFSMCMLYGPSSVFLCNDAYRVDSLGDKFPQALGQPMAEVWPEVWHVAAERIRSVMDGVSTWDEALQLFLERSGYLEETFHTFSYGPLHGDDGATVGVLCVVSEDTKRVLAGRRLAVLRDFGAALTAGTTRDAVAVAAHDILSRDVPDVPFAVGYLVAGDDPADRAAGAAPGDAADLHWSAGAGVGGPAAPSRLARGDGHPWSSVVFEGEPAVHTVDLDPAVAWPTGRWPEPPTQAMVLPLRQLGRREPYGHLVVGLNPRRALDADYTDFVELLADQLASALARAEAFEQERDRHAQQAELDRAKITFFTNVSHELRTPLTLLLGPAEDALTDADHPLDPTQRRRLELVSRNGERLLKLVNTLLDFSRLDAGRATAQYEPLDLHRFTSDLADLFEPAFARAGLTLGVESAELPDRPFVDREMWAKIVLNLLSNALKATFDGGVTVRLRDGGDAALLEVNDTGVGIPAEELGRLFERFHRVAGARRRSHEGTGIGLALVAELARQHGGRVDVRSEPGHGSTFTVRVPYGRDHLPAAEILDESVQQPDVAGLGVGYLAESLRWAGDTGELETAPGPDDGPATPTIDDGRPRVLVVDDSADVRDYVRGVLADRYAVRTAVDGGAALEAVRTDPPDIVLTDVMMPVLDGFGLLARLRDDPTTAHLPVIMLSARSGETAAVEGLEAGADDYLVKPFTSRELRARVQANLELDRVRRVLAELERSRAMLDNAERLARLGSWEIDLHHNTLRISPQMAATSDLDVEPMVPVGFSESITTAAPEDVPRLHEAIFGAIETGADADVEIWAVRESGERWRARVRASVVTDDSGTPRFLRGSTQDVTEQRRAEAELAEAHAVREVAVREHAIATELQRFLLPDRAFDAVQLEIASYYRAGVEGTQVGGDWYDVIDLGLGRTALVIGDVMGRGVRAAAVMGQLRAATRAYARLGLPPEEHVQLLDDTVRELGDDTIVTCFYAVYDPAEQSLDYANAGHLPGLLHVAGKPLERLGAGGPPLGSGGHRGTGARVAFPPGAVLALYTDGLVEQRTTDLDGRIDQLADRLSASLGEGERALAGLPDELAGAMLGPGTDDDVALLMCRGGVVAAGEHDARHRVTSGPQAVRDARQFAVRALHDWGVEDTVHYDVQVAVSELVTNGINHGSRPIELHLHLGGDRLRLAVRDGGDGRPAVRRSRPDDAHGRGLLIVTTLADAWGIDGGALGKTVWCEFRVQVGGADTGEQTA